MTADDARKMTDSGRLAHAKQIGDQTRIMLDCWHRAIEKAAKGGDTYVRENELSPPRTPISVAARKAALASLVAAGFTANEVGAGTGPGGFTTEVSWA